MLSRFRKSNKADEAEAKPADAVTSGSEAPRAPEITAEDEDEDAKGTGLEPTATTATEDIEYPSGLKLALLLSSIFISMFLVALDRLIIATAIPQITDDFHSVVDIGWYGSVYLLTTCAFQLMFGKLYTFFSVKYTFLISVGLFEVGSAVCGAAPSSVAFIIGRAVAGCGAAGIFSGVIVILVYAVPLHKRPLYQGIFGAVFGVASVLGPLLGGAFTTKVTWRWCFYINLPLGGVAMVFIFFLLKVPDRETANVSLRAKLAQLDALGTFFLVPGVICLLLALQWGGSTYPWQDGRIIALLVLAGVLLIAFVLVQVFMPDTATIPPRIFMQRSIAAAFFSTITVGSGMMIFVYFLPIWFQAIQGVSAVESGIRTLPLVLSMVVASISSGIITARIGYYTPVMIFGVVLLSIASGLLTTLELDTPQAKWVGYQFLFGFGLGFTFQAPNLAAQTVLPNKDVPIGTSLCFMGQLLGGAVFISVAQNVLNNQLLERLSALPGFSPAFLQDQGATSLTHLPPEIQGTVLSAYNESLRKVFQVGCIVTCLVILGALSLEWKSVKKNQVKKESKEGGAEEGRVEGVVEGKKEGEEATVDEKKEAAALAPAASDVGDDDKTDVEPEREKVPALEKERESESMKGESKDAALAEKEAKA